jgi:hypothetical protein
MLCAVVPALSAQAPSTSRVRPLDDLARVALDRGVADSPLFRRLVTELEASDLIVHVTTSFMLSSRTVGTTRLSSASFGHRYVRIAVDAQLSPEERVSVLGHELQHACEIARSAVRNGEAVRELFELIGRRVSELPNAYDTEEAVSAGVQVWHDIHRSSRRSTVAAQREFQ